MSQELVEELIRRDRSVVLFTHRHSLDTFRQVLPPQLKVTETMAVKPPGKCGAVLDNLVGDGRGGCATWRSSSVCQPSRRAGER